MFRATVCLWYYEILTVWIGINYAQKLANKVFNLQRLNILLLRERSVIHTFIFHLIPVPQHRRLSQIKTKMTSLYFACT